MAIDHSGNDQLVAILDDFYVLGQAGQQCLCCTGLMHMAVLDDQQPVVDVFDSRRLVVIRRTARIGKAVQDRSSECGDRHRDYPASKTTGSLK